MWAVVLVLCLMVAAFVIVASLAATRPSARPDVVDGELPVDDGELAASATVPAPAATAAPAPGQPLPSVIDD